MTKINKTLIRCSLWFIMLFIFIGCNSPDYKPNPSTIEITNIPGNFHNYFIYVQAIEIRNDTHLNDNFDHIPWWDRYSNRKNEHVWKGKAAVEMYCPDLSTFFSGVLFSYDGEYVLIIKIFTKPDMSDAVTRYVKEDLEDGSAVIDYRKTKETVQELWR